MDNVFKQPWVVAIGVIGLLMCVVFMIFVPSGAIKASFLLNVGVATTLVTKAALSMRSDAPASALALFACGAAVFVSSVLNGDMRVAIVESFQDAVFEGVAVAVAGAFAALVDEAISRNARMRDVKLE